MVAFVLVLTVPYMVISADNKYVLNTSNPAAIKEKDAKVGLVLGAGITKHGKPFKELQARLDTAANALNKGYVDKLILSGDNRFEYYDEPTAMENYLVNIKHVPKAKLQPDFAGRSTYESCERAAKIFGQKDKPVIIFSAGSHLPRAIYLCREFGIDAYGIANHIEANNATRREVLARIKAVLNIYVKGEPTILGDPIKI
jgi:SanA protein